MLGRCTLQEDCTLTSSGSAVGTCFMHRVAFASRLEPDVHKDESSFDAALALKLRYLSFPGQRVFDVKYLQVTGAFPLRCSFPTQSFTPVYCSFPKH